MALPPAPFLPRFAWKSPLFLPIFEAASALSTFDDWPSVAALDGLLGERAGVGFRAEVPRPKRRRRRAPLDPSALYDARIVREGWVPTRERSWHDLLNALVWASFPRSKRALHTRQHEAIAARIDASLARLPERRSRELDGLAIVDEGGLVLLCERPFDEEARGALAVRDEAAIARGIAAGRASALLFGHALYEHLVVGGQTVIAMTAVLPHEGPLPTRPRELCQRADELFAAAIATPGSFADPDAFRSLPVDLRLAPRASPSSG